MELSSLFFSSNKNPRNDEHEQQKESEIVNSSSLSSSDCQNLPSSSFSVQQSTYDIVSDTSSSSLSTSISLNESFETNSIPNDISASCNVPPVQPKLSNYPINSQKRSFQSS